MNKNLHNISVSSRKQLIGAIHFMPTLKAIQ